MSRDPIRWISVVSSGAATIRPEHVPSTGEPILVWLTTSPSWTAPRPINVHVIDHIDEMDLDHPARTGHGGRP